MELRNVASNLANHTILVGIISFVNGISLYAYRDHHITECVKKILKREFSDSERLVMTQLAGRFGKSVDFKSDIPLSPDVFGNPFSPEFQEALGKECMQHEGFFNCKYVITETLQRVNLYHEKVNILKQEAGPGLADIPIDPQDPRIEELLKPYCEQKTDPELASLLWRPALFVFGGIFVFWALSKLQANDRAKKAQAYLAAETPPKSPLTPAALA